MVMVMVEASRQLSNRFSSDHGRHRYPRASLSNDFAHPFNFCEDKILADLKMNGTPRECAINRTSISMTLNIDSRRCGGKALIDDKLSAK